MSGSLYEIVTLKIIEVLNQGVVPWRKPWHDTSLMPVNLITNKPYRGVNPWLLSSTEFADHRWLTFRQATELGAKVRSGEKSTMVVFWKFPENKKEDTEEEVKSYPILRYFNVFNVEQVDGLNLAPIATNARLTEEDRIARAETLIASMSNPPRIEEQGLEAWYNPRQDLVRIPKIEHFESVDGYYRTKFHELIHSSGHESRLKRPGVMEAIHFGSEGYSREELVAELGSAFCCSTVGLDNSRIDDSASYISGWLGALKSDPKALVIAAAQAQKAADYIKGIVY